jgi:hypothetical protein
VNVTVLPLTVAVTGDAGVELNALARELATLALVDVD